MVKQSITPDDVVKFMNQLHDLDPQAMNGLIKIKTLCNKKMGDHPTVQVSDHENGEDLEVGMLGVLNGLFGVIDHGQHKGMGPIAAMLDDQSGRLGGFVLVEKL